MLPSQPQCYFSLTPLTVAFGFTPWTLALPLDPIEDPDKPARGVQPSGRFPVPDRTSVRSSLEVQIGQVVAVEETEWWVVQVVPRVFLPKTQSLFQGWEFQSELLELFQNNLLGNPPLNVHRGELHLLVFAVHGNVAVFHRLKNGRVDGVVLAGIKQLFRRAPVADSNRVLVRLLDNRNDLRLSLEELHCAVHMTELVDDRFDLAEGEFVVLRHGILHPTDSRRASGCPPVKGSLGDV